MKHLIFIICMLSLLGCSSNTNDRGIYKKSNHYTNLLMNNNVPSVWNEIKGNGADYALENRVTNSIFLFTSACRQYEQSSLNTITSSMLSSLGRPTVLEKVSLKHQERDAELIKIRASVDGVERFLYTLTVLKNSCIYDYILISKDLKSLEADLNDYIHFTNAIILK